MLRPLLLLFAVIAVPGDARIDFNTSSVINISACPITYFGMTYDQVYVDLVNPQIVICFGHSCDNGTSIDFLRGPSPDPTISQEIVYESMILDVLLKQSFGFTTTFNCYVSFALGNNAAIFLMNYGTKAVVILSSTAPGTVTSNVTANGVLRQILSVTSGQLYDFADASACRFNGEVYDTDSTTIIPEDCETVDCSPAAVLSVTATCGPMETCLGNNMCVTTTTPPPTTTEAPTTTPTLIHSICTVTGPSVIDFSHHLDFVKDLCEQYLLQIGGLSVVGSFRERRHGDVSFLDSVRLTVNNNNIHLEQGGRVVVNGAPQDLSSPLTVGDVTVSKDHTGVTVVVQIQDLEITVFFDGYTAHILVDGSTGSSLEGLCKDSSSEARLPDCRSSSCDPHHNYTDDICSNNTKSCFYLNKAPFTSCGIDPEPYLDACTDLLSRYPAVDGLKCQFLTAYAKACSLYSNTVLHDWRFKTKCYHHGAFCNNKTCKDHEFCAESYTGDHRCFCRANFACEIRNNYTYGRPPVCKKNHASLTLYNCMLAAKNIDYKVLHLNDRACRGHLDEKENTVTFTFEGDNCGTKIRNNKTHIIYENAVMSQNVTDVITRHDMVRIDFSCYQTQPDLLTKAFTIINSDYKGVIVPGPWNYTLFIKAYIDDGCTTLVDSNTPIKLNQQVWVKLITKGLDGDVVVLVTDHCWATDDPSPTADNQHDLIVDGCPADPTVLMRGNGEETFNSFAFNMFEFSGGSTQIYLHCEVHLCVKSTNTCEPNCPGKRRRRSVGSKHDSPGLISMGWSS